MSEPEQHLAEPAYDVADEYRPEPPAPPSAPSWMDGSLRIGIHTSIAGDIVQALASQIHLLAKSRETRVPD